MVRIRVRIPEKSKENVGNHSSRVRFRVRVMVRLWSGLRLDQVYVRVSFLRNFSHL